MYKFAACYTHEEITGLVDEPAVCEEMQKYLSKDISPTHPTETPPSD
jgi:hypothetical protein